MVDEWQPSGPPKVLLPPDIEPDITMDELCLEIEDFGRLYYERSGRYLGTYATREEANAADAYRFTRGYLPGGRLPWER